MKPDVIARLRIGYPAFSLDVNLTLPGNQVTAIFGPSGSGKSTCLRAIAGLERNPPQPQSANAGQANDGFISVDGEIWQDDVHDLFLAPHLRALGFVFQEASLFAHLSVAQNLSFGQSRVPKALRRVSLEQAIELLGIGHLMNRQPHALSGGERQRVAIARALATSPRMLLMDEPLAALDAARKAEVLPYLANLQRELAIPVLYVTHSLDEVARLADHLVMLDAGRVVASGPAAELMTRMDLPIAQGDAASALVHATVVSHDPVHHLTQARFSGGEFAIPLQTLAIGDSVRIRVQARDVSLTLAHQSGTSIQNIVPVRIVTLGSNMAGQIMVQLDAAGSTLLARVTARAVAQLDLRAGQALFAQVKGVAIVG